jgi:hypothetical protein
MIRGGIIPTALEVRAMNPKFEFHRDIVPEYPCDGRLMRVCGAGNARVFRCLSCDSVFEVSAGCAWVTIILPRNSYQPSNSSARDATR